jgi:hypothetical protein
VREEDKDLVIKVLSESANGNHSFNMTQVYIDVLPVGGPTALFPIKCPAYRGGVARKPR